MKFFNLNEVHLLLENTFNDVKIKDVKNCTKDLCFFMKNLSNSSLKATKIKYMYDRNMKVAEIVQGNL